MKLLLALLFLLVTTSVAFAQSQLPPNIFDSAAGAPGGFDPPIAADNCPTYEGYVLNPCIVSEGDFVVSLSIRNLPLNDGSEQYYYCLKTNPLDCSDKDFKSTTSSPVTSARVGGLVTVTFPTLCGDGENKLKTGCDTDGSDFFHAGKTYRVAIFDDNKKGAAIVREAGFYVSHFYPTVVLPISSDASAPIESPELNIRKIRAAGGYNLVIELSGRNNKDPNGDETKVFNDYFLRVEGFDNDYKGPESCIYIPESGSATKTITLPLDSKDKEGRSIAPLTEGSYLLSIKDGRDGKGWNANHTCKENDFTYYIVPFIIAGGENNGKFEVPIKDPRGKEQGLRSVRPTPLPLCDDADKNLDGYCTKIPTALGIKIHTEPQLFVRDTFTIVISIGGIATTIFFIQAGYTLMTSAGNKEKVAQAREQITAAIMGLVFIILSITILEFIGVNILRIPGFGN